MQPKYLGYRGCAAQQCADSARLAAESNVGSASASLCGRLANNQRLGLWEGLRRAIALTLPPVAAATAGVPCQHVFPGRFVMPSTFPQKPWRRHPRGYKQTIQGTEASQNCVRSTQPCLCLLRRCATCLHTAARTACLSSPRRHLPARIPSACWHTENDEGSRFNTPANEMLLSQYASLAAACWAHEAGPALPLGVRNRPTRRPAFKTLYRAGKLTYLQMCCACDSFRCSGQKFCQSPNSHAVF